MAPLALKVKTKNGQQIINTLTPESTIIELKRLLSNVSKIPINRLHALSGYPPKILDFTRDTVQLVNCGIKSGDTLILEEKPESEQPSQPSGCTTKDITPSQPLEEVPAIVQGILMKHIVPADNSCLFTSINYVLSGKVDDTVAPFMRKLIAETITNAKEIYSEAILGKPVQDYCAWIQDDNSWGGAIELAILSNHYGVEIAVVDTINAIINRFGEDQNYPHRVFLMFDGIHYDPLYLEPFDVCKTVRILSFVYAYLNFVLGWKNSNHFPH